MEQKTITLLLDCLHQDAARVSSEQLASLSSGEWRALITLAQTQKVGGALYHRLKSRGAEKLAPQESWLALQSTYWSNAANNLSMQRELHQIITALHEREIQVIVLKGAYLADVVYNNPALRQMTDIDLLVKVDYLERTVEVLGVQSYILQQPYLRSIEPRLIKTDNLSIDVHWNVSMPNLPYSMDADELWANAVPVSLAGTTVLGLCAEDLLLHICMHWVYKHQLESGIQPICDIAATINHYRDTLNWEKLAQRARQWKWDRGVYLAFRLAKELVGAAVPEEILQNLQPVVFDESLLIMAQRYMSVDQKIAHVVSPRLAQLWHASNPIDKMLELLRAIFLPKITIASMYGISPSSLRLYFYYAVRLKDILLKYWRVTLSLYRGDPMLISIAYPKAILGKWLAEESSAHKS